MEEDEKYILISRGKKPDDSLKHYGVLGMRWGVRREDRGGSSNSSSSRSKPPELSTAASKAVAAKFYSKKSSSDLQQEGMRKLKEQSKQTFPEKKAIGSRRETLKQQKSTFKLPALLKGLKRVKKT